MNKDIYMNINIKKYISDNITTLSDSKNKLLHDYIISNNIIHSENQNGLFINLSVCDETHIQYFYEIITINENKEYTNDIVRDTTIDTIESYKSEETKRIKKPESSITKKDIHITAIEKIILSYSY